MYRLAGEEVSIDAAWCVAVVRAPGVGHRGTLQLPSETHRAVY